MCVTLSGGWNLQTYEVFKNKFSKLCFSHWNWCTLKEDCLHEIALLLQCWLVYCDRLHWSTPTASHCHLSVLSMAAWQLEWFQCRWRCLCQGGLVPLSGCVCMQLFCFCSLSTYSVYIKTHNFTHPQNCTLLFWCCVRCPEWHLSVKVLSPTISISSLLASSPNLVELWEIDQLNKYRR